MCILFLAIRKHEEFPLIVAANRDEFYSRPTRSSHLWQSDEGVLAGRDEQAGGSWMGLSRSGRVAALTNVRGPTEIVEGGPSRGGLVLDYLRGDHEDSDYLERLEQKGDRYSGFNLLFGHWNALHVYSNRNPLAVQLESGFFGLSNAALNTPWPKLSRGVKAMEDYVSSTDSPDPDQLMMLLRDESRAEDSNLPHTGVPIETERMLSSIFIRSETYGTRASTVLLVDREGGYRWTEQTYGVNGTLGQRVVEHGKFA